MRSTCLSLSLFSVLLIAGCNNAPTPTDKVVAAEPATPVQPGPDATKLAAAEPGPSPSGADAEEDGCIYKDTPKAAHGQEADEAAGCPHGDGAGVVDSGVPGHYGAVFALQQTVPLSQVLASVPADPNEAVQVSGEVDSVCQKKGCWLVVKDGDAMARILMKDHSFTVPMDSKGKPVVIEGTIETRTFTEAQVKHLEKDGGGDPSKVGGERKEYVLTATGIRLATS